MSRYYFDLLDGDALAIDDEGLELSDTRRVQAEAAKSLADMARDAAEATLSDSIIKWLSRCATRTDL
ncbi:DUF6894 family protein [Bradyrhizobium japonicum]|uniref:DUF6894 family protein n=1 Tax=Bradyrhizobium japonicum TaxID=375 RepID=UPI00289E7718|nr:hypothetical protein [Bradyrhizobium japonicum]